MATTPNKLSGKAELDTTDFKTNIAQLNRELRVVESGFKATAAGLGDWSQSATGLEGRIKALTSEIDIQGQKVDNTRAQYMRMVEAYGENSRAAQDMLIRLNKETATYNSMNSELKSTQAELKNFGSGQDDAKQKTDSAGRALETFKTVVNGVKTAVVDLGKGTRATFNGLGQTVKAEIDVVTGVLKVGTAAMIGMTLAAIGITAALAGLVFSSASAADQLGEMADKTGISVQRLQELNYIGKVVGTDVETIASSQARMTRSMYAASQGTKAQTDAFAELGVAVVDANGHLRNQQDVFNDSIETLGRIENPTLRDALAMQIFGKSAQELNPLIKEGKAGLQALTNQAHLLGAVMSDENVKALGDFNDMLDGLKLGLQGIGGTLAATFLPAFTGFFTVVQGYMVDLVGIVKGSNGDIGKLISGVGDLFSRMATALAAQLPAMAETGLQIIQVVINAILGALPTLIPAAIGILNTLVGFLLSNLQLLGNVGLQLISQFGQTIVNALPQLLSVGMQILQGVFQGIIGALPTLIPLAAQILTSLSSFLVQALGALNEAAPVIIMALVNGLAEELPILLTGASAIIKGLITAITTLVPQLLPVAVGILKSLVNFLAQNLTLLATAAVQIINELLTALLPLLPLIIQAALQIIVALANGITQALPTLIPVITDVVIQIVQMLAENLPLLINAALLLVMALAKGLVIALPVLIAALPKIITTLLDGLIAAEPQLAAVAGELLGVLAIGIIDALPVILDAAIKIGQELLKPLPGNFLQNIGVQLIAGLWAGIQERWRALLADFMVLVNALPDAIKQLLGFGGGSGSGSGSGGGGGGNGPGSSAQNVSFPGIGGPGPNLGGLGASLSGAPAASGLAQTFDYSFHFENRGTVIIQGPQTPGSIGKAIQQKARRY